MGELPTSIDYVEVARTTICRYWNVVVKTV